MAGWFLWVGFEKGRNIWKRFRHHFKSKMFFFCLKDFTVNEFAVEQNWHCPRFPYEWARQTNARPSRVPRPWSLLGSLRILWSTKLGVFNRVIGLCSGSKPLLKSVRAFYLEGFIKAVKWSNIIVLGPKTWGKPGYVPSLERRYC